MSNGYGITIGQAEQLEGVTWKIDENSYRFASRDGSAHHEKPWFGGAEGIAFPLNDMVGETVYFAKFFKPNKASKERMKRFEWFIDQCVFSWAPELAAAPCRILNTKEDGRPDGIEFDFCCVLSQAVCGMSWVDAKAHIADGIWTPTDCDRGRWVEQLVRGLAILERHGICHGDISHNNVVVDRNGMSGQPTLRLVDFDGFTASGAGEFGYLLESEGGTIGTDGYCPPVFETLRQRGESCVHQKSDRYARDMLILELLLYDGSWECDEPISQYDRDLVVSRVRRSGLPPGLRHLGRSDIFELKEQNRPRSVEVAQQMGLSLPPRRKQTNQGFPASTTGGVAARHAITSMCACALGLWIVISYYFVQVFVPGSAEGIAYFAQLLLRVLLFTASLFACGMLLASVTLPRGLAQRLQIGRLDIEIPRRRQRTRRGASTTFPDGLNLCRAGVVLLVVVGLLMRFGAR